MKRLSIALTVLLILLMLPTSAFAEGGALYIDTIGIYDGMTMSYAQGYVPKISGGNALFVLPLKSSDADIPTITVTPLIGTEENTPFSYGNYEFNVTPDANGVFVIRLTLTLKANRVNGTYPVVFQCRYTDSQGTARTQEFPIYLSITDGHNPDEAEPTPVVDQLRIDSQNLYNGMTKTYAQGYMPLVSGGKAYIVLPLIGQTYDGKVTLTANLGTALNSPFVYGNYSQTASGGWSAYVFVMEIPLAKDRYNGSYPVILKADYLDISGKKASQEFTVYVTVADGKTPPDPNDVPKVEVEKPELFISACTINPDTVGGDEEFVVDVTVKNIGAIRARSVRLTFGSEAVGIVPVETNNSILLDNIASAESTAASFKLKTTTDVLAGNQPFYITLDYVDLYGGVYTATRTFLVNVTQPAEIKYDPITVPKDITAGETLSLPANVFNVGKSTLRNVTITVTGAGVFPVSSVFLGDILPGEAGNGVMKVFIGMLSMTEGYTESYGKTNGKYIITYSDDTDEEYKIELDFSTEIKQPKIEADEADSKLTEKPAFQWWVMVLVGFAIIAIIIAVIFVSKFSRMMRMK